jgi:hypothetical protein
MSGDSSNATTCGSLAQIRLGGVHKKYKRPDANQIVTVAKIHC